MKIIKVTYVSEIPKNYTGIVEYPSGSKAWYKGGKRHRLDGPACEYANGSIWYQNGKYHRTDGPAYDVNGYKKWWLKGKRYYPITHKNYVIIGEYQGLYGTTWLKILLKDQIIELPDIPGLIEK